MTDFELLTDDELVGLYAEGNNEAFDALLERYKSKVYSYIFHSVRDEAVADDLFQETFVKVICSIQAGRYRAEGRFGPWLTRIARNLILDHHRDRASSVEVAGEALAYDPLNSRRLAEPDCEEERIKDETMDDVRALVALLPQSQREIVRMRMYEGLQFKEIALRLDISISTALGRMRYALINLRKLAARRGVVLTVD